MANYNVIIPHYSVILAEGLAKIIQNQYEFKHQITMELLSSAMNDIYRVQSGDFEYFLKMPRHHRFWPYNAEVYQFHAELLHFLHTSNLSVSYPIPTSSKQLMGIINAPEGIRYYSLFTKAKGTEPDLAVPYQMEMVGRYLGTLHRLTENYRPQRQGLKWDFDLLINYGLDKISKYVPEDIKHDFSTIEDRSKVLLSMFRDLIPQHNSSNWGLIHGDFTPKNVRIQNEDVSLFDFEYSGYGYRIFDCVFMLNQTNPRDPKNEFFRAFLDGYQRERRLSTDEIKAIPILSKLALVSRMTMSVGMRDLVGVLWFDRKLRNDLRILKKLI